MKILAVTSWSGACGIANYAEMLIEAVQAADPTIQITPSAEALDPEWLQHSKGELPDCLWLNYHKGLHSRWTPKVLWEFKEFYGAQIPIVITMHDTVGEHAPDDLTQSLHDLADAFVVHEPCVGLPKQILIRQGVPATAVPVLIDHTYRASPPTQDQEWPQFPLSMPVLGTVGFNFGWKNFDRLAEVTAACGWAYLICCNNATDADVARWTTSNPWTYVLRGFRSTGVLVGYLSACDATCFAYECANSGTSGAIRLGLAARKPVLAWGGCRQFNDLWLGEAEEREPDPRIEWVWNWQGLAHSLATIPIQRVDPGIVAIAHRDSWVAHGHRYAEVFRGVLR